MTNLDSILKNRDIILPTKVHLVKAMVFPVVVWELDYKECWTLKNWCFFFFWIDAFELWCWRRLLRVPWIARRSKPVHPKGNQSWIFIGRTDVEADTPILWLPDGKSWLIWKDPDAGTDWRWEEKGTTGWVGWMASLTQWTGVWVGSRNWWWTERPGMLQSMGSQRVGHDWATELIGKLGAQRSWRLSHVPLTLCHDYSS